MTNHRFAWILCALVAAACGGASRQVRPTPLRYHFKEQHLAAVPAGDKAEMLKARDEYHRARQENRQAESDRARNEQEIEAAERDARKARGKKEAADSAAEKPGDWNQVNLAKRDKRVAEVTARAADQKVEMLKARRSWLEARVQFTREYVFAAEADYELAKAKVARAHDIAPPDFAFQAYVDQSELRRRKAEKLKGPADDQKASWLEEKKEYQAKRRDENEARGVDTAAKSDEKKK